MEGPRGTEEDEFSLVLDLVNLVFRTSRSLPATMRQEFPLLFRESNLENLRIILDNGKPVSHIGICQADTSLYGCKVRVGMVGAVCTHPEYRGRGLATKVLADCIRKMSNDGVDIVLVSGIRSLYYRAGCVIAGRVYRVKISKEDSERLPLQGFELKPLEEGNILDVVEAHQKEPVRFYRTLGDLQELLQAAIVDYRTGTVHKRDTFIIGDGHQSLGYLVVKMVKAPPEGQARAFSVVEYGGSRGAIVDALGLLFDQHGGEELHLAVPAYDVELLSLLRRAGISLPESTGFSGTIRLLNFPRLIDKVRPYLGERLGDLAERLTVEKRDGSFIFHHGREVFTVEDERALAGFVLGIPEKVEPKYEQFLPRAQVLPGEGRLPQMLRKAFPLPTIMYGLNYT